MATKRDDFTIDMFPENPPDVIPRSKSLVAKPKKSPKPSVPIVPLQAAPIPTLVEPVATVDSAPGAPAPQQADTLFPHSYLIVLFLAVGAIGVVIADNLYDYKMFASLIQHRAHITSRLDQYLIAASRGVLAYIVAFVTVLCGVHIAARPTALPWARFAIAGLFVATASILAVITYICEHDFMALGLSEIWRRLRNLAGMRW